jgi:hypothetical protein
MATDSNEASIRELDHHVVVVNGQRCVLLTYHLCAEPPPDVPRVYVLFQYADRHPHAPEDVQRMIQEIPFVRG